MRKIFNNPQDRLSDFHFVLNNGDKVYVHKYVSFVIFFNFFKIFLCSILVHDEGKGL